MHPCPCVCGGVVTGHTLHPCVDLWGNISDDAANFLDLSSSHEGRERSTGKVHLLPCPAIPSSLGIPCGSYEVGCEARMNLSAPLT